MSRSTNLPRIPLFSANPNNLGAVNNNNNHHHSDSNIDSYEALMDAYTSSSSANPTSTSKFGKIPTTNTNNTNTNNSILPPLTNRSRKNTRIFDDLRAAAVLDAIEKGAIANNSIPSALDLILHNTNNSSTTARNQSNNNAKITSSSARDAGINNNKKKSLQMYSGLNLNSNPYSYSTSTSTSSSPRTFSSSSRGGSQQHKKPKHVVVAEAIQKQQESATTRTATSEAPPPTTLTTATTTTTSSGNERYESLYTLQQTPRQHLQQLQQQQSKSKAQQQQQQQQQQEDNKTKKTLIAPAPPAKENIITTARTKSSSSNQPQTTVTTTTTTSRQKSSHHQHHNIINKNDNKRGLSPSSASREYHSILASFELDELPKYRHIYFAGTDLRRKIPLSTSGFDDDGADYKIVTGDHVAYRYEITSVLGKGSFGTCVRAIDHKTGQNVALKIIKNKKKFHEQARVEIKIIEYVNEHAAAASATTLSSQLSDGGGNDDSNNSNTNSQMFENIFVKLRDSFVFRNHVVMVFDLHGSSLYDRMKASNFSATPMYLIQSYARQMIQALAFMASEHIIHTDIKPENILVARGDISSIRVIDFGSACFEHQRVHSYIQSRFYRAPEICLGIPYTPRIDIWSVGVLIYELLSGSPMFPAQNEAELMTMITARLGPVPLHLLDGAPRRKYFYDSGSNVLKTKCRSGISKMSSIPSLFGTNDQELAHLVSCMVRFDPKSRITPQEALKHPFFQKEFSRPSQQQSSNNGRNVMKRKYSYHSQY